ncbi:hypothetical protein [Paenibacillus sp. S-12]|uniref:hypothetical protein n=1 Tax=Paenibacillus sp. S-12 TaxID=3031371 RepID=UPI0025A0F776|nr:hypothetical protein [Paenibacillus sp. S-12]
MTVPVLISSLIQVILFSVIPLVCWFLFARKEQSFFEWIGCKVPVIQKSKLFFTVFFSAFLLFVSLGHILRCFLPMTPMLLLHKFYGVGVSGIAAALLYAFVDRFI